MSPTEIRTKSISNVSHNVSRNIPTLQTPEQSILAVKVLCHGQILPWLCSSILILIHLLQVLLFAET
jgi:hypothetical protein